jgi:hypothetical protein
MKKLLLSTIVLLAFSVSIILFQLSCKKSADAATPITSAAVQQQNKIIYVKNIPIVAAGTSGLYQGQIYSANYDGTNQQQINITLPTGLYISYTPNVVLSPDQKTIFFSVSDINNVIGIYSSSIDGTNTKPVIAPNSTGPWIEIAY